ncbi:uncharacterized protein LOC115273385 [Suricata suricatta]|uniref:uncharacterized protein LOC115273385 n=1 Tax=Suricata suricatta TaxID=37032 RepID=UPI001155E403|nr:uncharacterized protein LOC115273385 [Suricata suricatta]
MAGTSSKPSTFTSSCDSPQNFGTGTRIVTLLWTRKQRHRDGRGPSTPPHSHPKPRISDAGPPPAASSPCPPARPRPRTALSAARKPERPAGSPGRPSPPASSAATGVSPTATLAARSGRRHLLAHVTGPDGTNAALGGVPVKVPAAAERSGSISRHRCHSSHLHTIWGPRTSLRLGLWPEAGPAGRPPGAAHEPGGRGPGGAGRAAGPGLAGRRGPRRRPGPAGHHLQGPAHSELLLEAELSRALPSGLGPGFEPLWQLCRRDSCAQSPLFR